jgi:hypothetical protein
MKKLLVLLVILSFVGVIFTDLTQNAIPVPPSNAEVEQAIDKAEDVLSQMKAEGYENTPPHAQRDKERIIEDLQEVLLNAKELIEKKNRGDLLQRFIIHSNEAIRRLAVNKGPQMKEIVSEDASRLSRQIDTELLNRKINRLVTLLRSIIFRTLQSPEFRDIINDFSLWIKEGLLQPALSTASQTLGAAKEATDAAESEIIQKQDVASTVLGKGKEALYETYEKGKDAVKEFTHNVYDKAQEKAGDAIYKLTDEEKQKLFISRYHSLINRIAQDPNLRQASQEIIELLEILKMEARKLKLQLEETAQKTKEVSTFSTQESAMINRSLTEGKELLHQLLGIPFPSQSVGGRSYSSPITQFSSGLHELFDLLQEDEATSDFFYHLRTYLQKTLDRPTLVLGEVKEEAGKKLPVFEKNVATVTKQQMENHRKEGEILLQQAKDIFKQYKYSEPVDKMLQSWQKVDYLVRNDPIGNRFAMSLRKLLKDIAWDPKYGSIGFNLETLTRMKSWMIPMITSAVTNISLPRIVGSTDNYDYAIEGLHVADAVILPEHVHLTTKEDIDFDMQGSSFEQVKAFLTIQLLNIQTSIHNASFWFQRKQFPRLEGEGLVDLELTGDGADIIFEIEGVYHGDKPTEFTIHDIKCNIDRLNVNVKEAKYKWLYNVINTLFGRVVKARVERGVETALWKGVQELSTEWGKWNATVPEHLNELLGEFAQATYNKN